MFSMNDWLGIVAAISGLGWLFLAGMGLVLIEDRDGWNAVALFALFLIFLAFSITSFHQCNLYFPGG